MNHIIQTIEEKKLVGKSLKMSFAEDKTSQLWGSFMPHKSKVKHQVSTNVFSLQVYNAVLDYKTFNPLTLFTKHALVEVSKFDDIPKGLDTFILPKGLYAVFTYKGLAKDVAPFFKEIMTVWLPQSKYNIDDRPHFELIPENYNPNNPDSQEDFYIPIIPK